MLHNKKYQDLGKKTDTKDDFKEFTIQDFRNLKQLSQSLYNESRGIQNPDENMEDLEKTQESNDEETTSLGIKEYKKKSDVFPSLQISAHVKAFVTQVTKEIEILDLDTKLEDNLSPQLWKALNTLKNNKDILIKTADKGGNVGVVTDDQYRKMYTDIS